MFDIKHKIALLKGTYKDILRILNCLLIMLASILAKIEEGTDTLIFSIKKIFTCTLKIYAVQVMNQGYDSLIRLQKVIVKTWTCLKEDKKKIHMTLRYLSEVAIGVLIKIVKNISTLIVLIKNIFVYIQKNYITALMVKCYNNLIKLQKIIVKMWNKLNNLKVHKERLQHVLKISSSIIIKIERRIEMFVKVTKDRFGSALKENIIPRMIKCYNNWLKLQQGIFNLVSKQCGLKRYMRQTAMTLLCLTVVYAEVPHTFLAYGFNNGTSNIEIKKKYFAAKDDLMNPDYFSLAEEGEEKVGRIQFGRRPASLRYIKCNTQQNQVVEPGPITWLIAGSDKSNLRPLKNTSSQGIVIYSEEPLIGLEADTADNKLTNVFSNEQNDSLVKWENSTIREQLKKISKDTNYFTDEEQKCIMQPMLATDTEKIDDTLYIPEGEKSGIVSGQAMYAGGYNSGVKLPIHINHCIASHWLCTKYDDTKGLYVSPSQMIIPIDKNNVNSAVNAVCRLNIEQVNFASSAPTRKYMDNQVDGSDPNCGFINIKENTPMTIRRTANDVFSIELNDKNTAVVCSSVKNSNSGEIVVQGVTSAGQNWCYRKEIKSGQKNLEITLDEIIEASNGILDVENLSNFDNCRIWGEYTDQAEGITYASVPICNIYKPITEIHLDNTEIDVPYKGIYRPKLYWSPEDVPYSQIGWSSPDGDNIATIMAPKGLVSGDMIKVTGNKVGQTTFTFASKHAPKTPLAELTVNVTQIPITEYVTGTAAKIGNGNGKIEGASGIDIEFGSETNLMSEQLGTVAGDAQAGMQSEAKKLGTVAGDIHTGTDSGIKQLGIVALGSRTGTKSGTGQPKTMVNSQTGTKSGAGQPKTMVNSSTGTKSGAGQPKTTTVKSQTEASVGENQSGNNAPQIEKTSWNQEIHNGIISHESEDGTASSEYSSANADENGTVWLKTAGKMVINDFMVLIIISGCLMFIFNKRKKKLSVNSYQHLRKVNYFTKIR